jgi:SSS family solute:Na+ symporter
VLVIKSLHSNLYVYLQSVQGYLSPAIAVLFVMGVFWKRATAPAAFWSFTFGVAAGFARLAVDIYMRSYETVVTGAKNDLYHQVITLSQYKAIIAPIQQKYGLIYDLWTINWLYYCQILFVLTAALMIVISLLTKAPDPKTVKFTWYGATAAEKAATRASWSSLDVILSLIVIACVILFYIKFW